MAIEIVSFPIKNGGSLHSYVAVYQRVYDGDDLLLSHRFIPDIRGDLVGILN